MRWRDKLEERGHVKQKQGQIQRSGGLEMSSLKWKRMGEAHGSDRVGDQAEASATKEF